MQDQNMKTDTKTKITETKRDQEQDLDFPDLQDQKSEDIAVCLWGLEIIT